MRGCRDRAPDVVETAHTAGSHGGSVEGLDKINSVSTSAYVDTARLQRRVRLSKRHKRFGRNVQDVYLHKMSLWAL